MTQSPPTLPQKRTRRVRPSPPTYRKHIAEISDSLTAIGFPDQAWMVVIHHSPFGMECAGMSLDEWEKWITQQRQSKEQDRLSRELSGPPPEYSI